MRIKETKSNRDFQRFEELFSTLKDVQRAEQTRVRSDSHTAVRTGVWLQITAVGEGAPRSSAAFMFALSLKLLNSVSKKKYKANVHVQSSLGHFLSRANMSTLLCCSNGTITS